MFFFGRLMVVALLLTFGVPAMLHAKNDKKLRKAGERRVPGYLVLLELPVATTREEVAALAVAVADDYKIPLTEVWADAGKAFFTHMKDSDAEAVSDDPRVRVVEENAAWDLSSVIRTNVDPADCDPTSGSCSTVPDNRLWHLDRIDQNTATPSLTQSYCTTGTNKVVYIVDSGVNKQHQEFAPGGARVLKGHNASGDNMDADDPCMGFAIPPDQSSLLETRNYLAEAGQSGHGTAVASLVGGRRLGVAKNVTIIPIKVFRCDQYSARARRASTAYKLNETMFVPTGSTSGRYYRALNDGTTGATPPSSWPTVANGAHLTVWDGGVQWQHFDTAPAYSTDKLMNGLNWILSLANTQGPKSHAVVTLSTYFPATATGVAGPTDTIESAVRDLLAANMTVVASANNHNADACDTSPARMSVNGPPGVANDVITVGGTMLVNRPWSVAVVANSNEAIQIFEADGVRISSSSLPPYGTEPPYSSAAPVREARWICGAGDSGRCSNDTSTSTIDPTLSGYLTYNAGSNAGRCVTLFAPAKNIPVAGILGADDYRDPRVRGIQDQTNGVFRGNASGTSWSAPIVAGVAARILEANPTFTPAQVRAKLLENSVATLDPATLNTRDHNNLEITGTPNAVLRDGDINITTQPRSQAAALAGQTPLTVAAGSLTSNSFTYQWFEVNAGFDYATHKSGAYSSLPIAGAEAATYNAAASPTTKAYFVRVSNGCSSADSDIAVVVPRPSSSPANVLATASGANVTVTWTSGSGAEKYEIQRKVAQQPWTRAGLVPAGVFTFTEVPAAPGGIVVYRVLSVAGDAYLPPAELASSAPSNNDFANSRAAAYEAIGQPPSNLTAVKAQHVIELRQAVNALCDTIGVPHEFSPTEVQLSALQGTLISAAHLTDVMNKANAVRTNALVGIGPASFSAAPIAGAPVKRSHLQEAREAVQ